MADLIIPDDSYVTLDEANHYHAMRESFSVWGELEDGVKLRRLVSASDFLDVNYKFLEKKLNSSQPRQFPRTNTGGTDKNGIPTVVKIAVFELALQSDLNQNEEQKMSSVKVGPLSVNYEQSRGLDTKANRFSYVKSLLDSYLDKNTGCGTVQMLRG